MQAIAVASLVVQLACARPATAEPATAPIATRDSGGRETTAGAKSDINRRFLDPKLDVEEWTKRFEGESREVYLQRANIANALSLREGMAVADIGAGTGLFEGLFSKAVGPTGTVHAVEISPRFLDHLRKRKEREGWGNVEVVEGTETSPRLPLAAIDLVFICDTYHHFTDVAEILRNIKAALKPAGRLVVVDFHRKPGVSKKWILDHVRADKKTFRAEIEAAGFRLRNDLAVAGLEENYAMEFEVVR